MTLRLFLESKIYQNFSPQNNFPFCWNVFIVNFEKIGEFGSLFFATRGVRADLMDGYWDSLAGYGVGGWHGDSME